MEAVQIIGLKRVGPNPLRDQDDSTGIAGILERFGREQLDALIVAGMGIEAALHEHDSLVCKPGKRLGHGSDLGSPGTEAVSAIAAADEHSTEQNEGGGE
jgi:hypothetical protein